MQVEISSTRPTDLSRKSAEEGENTGEVARRLSRDKQLMFYVFPFIMLFYLIYIFMTLK